MFKGSVELPSNTTSMEATRQYEWDARDERLPPCWVPRNDVSGDVERNIKESGRIYVTDQSGELRNKLLTTIEAAEEFVCLSSFLLADTGIVKALLEASKRGRRVYLLTASETQLLKEPREDNEFDQQRREEHIRLLRELAGHVLVRSADNFHAKFLLVDPRTRNARGFLLTANLTTEALTRNPELAMELERDEAQDLFRQFLIGFWEESQNELLGPDRLSNAKPLGERRQWAPPKTLLSTTKGTKTIKQTMLDLIDRADTEIILSTFGIDPQHPATQRLLNAVLDGKKVRILARPRPSKPTMTALVSLAQAGAEVRGHPWLHAKSLLIDRKGGWEGMIMTSNIEAKGLDEGFESGILLQGKDADDLHTILERWWSGLPLKFSLTVKLGEVEGPVQVWHDGKSVRVSIKKNGQMNLGEMKAKSSEEMENTAPPSFPKPSLPKSATLYYKILYTWRVLAPNASKGSEKNR